MMAASPVHAADGLREATHASGQASATPDLARAFSYRLHALNKCSEQGSRKAYLQGAGLSLGDGRCLATVGAFEPLSINDLARVANLNKGQASRAAQSLVDRGLACKEEHPDDGRGVVLTLTAEGRARWARVMALIEQHNQALLATLTPEEQSQFSALLDKVLVSRGGC